MSFRKSLLALSVSSALLTLAACSSSSSTDNTDGTGGSTGSLSSKTIGLTNDNVYVLATGFPGTIIGNGDAADGDTSNDDDMTLNIEAGTLILGSEKEALVISRGSKVNISGTQADPVVMTSKKQFDDWVAGGNGTAGRGEWAGFALMGYAKTNECGTPCDVASEGNIGAYGGTNDADNSGSIDYLVVRHAGNDLDGNGNELNGFTLFGVGSGTHMSHIQVHKGLDDGIEHFGSADFMDHIVLTDNADDGFDWGQGYTGGAQFIIAKQADDDGDRGIEADNDKGSPLATPVSLPTLANMTFIGPVNPSTEASTADGILLRRGTGAKIYNTIVYGAPDNCLDIDEKATMEMAVAAANTTPFNYTGKLMVQNTFLSCATSTALKTADQDLDGDGVNDTFDAFGLPSVSQWFAESGTGNNAAAVAELNTDTTAGPIGVPVGTFASTVKGSALAINLGGNFVATDYAGAFDPTATTQWTDDWTVGLNGNTTVWQPASSGTLAGNTPVADGTCPEGTTAVGKTSLPDGQPGEMDICQLEERYDATDVN